MDIQQQQQQQQQQSGWLWQGLGEIAASADLACCSAAAATGTATLRTTPDAWAVPLLLQPYELRRAAGLQRALACERLASLAGLGQLRVLRLVGAPAPLDVLRQLSALSQLQVLAVNAACDMPLSAAAAAAASVKDAHAAAAAAPGADAAAGSGVGEAQPGTEMGAALVKLQRLSQLTLSGVSDAACASLGQLSGLASLTQLDIKDCRELRVAALGQLSALSNLRVLKVRRLPQLRTKARAALPLELTGLRALAALALDCDLHLRDIQVLSDLLVGAVDSNVFSAVQGHPTLRRLVLGPGPQPASQLAAAAGPSVAAWGKLGTLPHLQSIKLSNTAGLMPGQDCSAALLGLSQASQLSLHQAGPFGDEHAWLLGSLFKRLQQLHLEGATALTDAGLAHLSFCPLLRLSLAGCPSVTVEGLRRLLLTCQSLQAVQLVGCTAVLPDQVEALQQAVWVVTGRRVELSWRSSKRGPGKQQHA
ncbi:hypothetical protein OEZ85_011363 [Tetradesmus obliquus]|uniref:Uncharacterized protein n=1 Tax=Tetradesmus obliquus TaxID=3088 RepID=A0ABY8TU05_TETOB|nr:hypothetical protein OEZ85_011363 [Tetradesmus obliquus]